VAFIFIGSVGFSVFKSHSINSSHLDYEAALLLFLADVLGLDLVVSFAGS
jgi:hypothetical protein